MNSKLILSVGAAAILASALFYGLRSPTPAVNPTPGAVTTPGAATNAASVAKNTSIDNTPSPWANSGNGVALPGGDKSVTDMTNADGKNDARNSNVVPGKKLTPAELQKFQDELLATVQSGNPDAKKLKEILTRLKQTQGNTVGGVNVDVLLNNLEKSQQIQDVATQLQKESQKPGGPDQRKMQDYMDSLKKLQAQMRTDVMVANPAMQMQAK